MENKTILLINEYPDISKVIRGVIKVGLPDITFYTTQNLEDAKSILEERVFELIILDWEPGSGKVLEFVEWIKNNAGLKNIPIIAEAAHIPDLSAAPELRPKIDIWIQKPYIVEDILPSVQKIFEINTD